MKQSIFHWQLAGFLFTSILGTFLHFLYELSGQTIITALFSAVNESIWEHLKLIYYPMFLYSFIESRFGRLEYTQFWCIKLRGILVGLILIPVIFYTYTGILGISADWFNITIFFIAAAAAFWSETLLFQRERICRISPRIAFLIICLIGTVFIVFTFFPPHIPLFRDPISGNFGFHQRSINS